MKAILMTATSGLMAFLVYNNPYSMILIPKNIMVAILLMAPLLLLLFICFYIITLIIELLGAIISGSIHGKK